MNNGNWNANKNGNGNKNGNTNANANRNSNRVNSANDVNVNVSAGAGSGGGGGPYDGGFGYGNGNGFGGGFGGNSYTGGTFAGGTFAPVGGTYSPTFAYNPSYDFSNNGGFGMPLGVAAVGGPPLPNLALDEIDPDTAGITLELPNDEAEVWLNGAKMPQKGLTRKYITPPLEQGKLYNYEIKVQWPQEKGRPKGAKLNYGTTLQFKAGDDILHKVPEEGDGKAAAPAPKKEPDPQDEEKLMGQKLTWAKILLKEGMNDKAKERLKEIVNKSPDSAAGKEAKELLSKL